jgi:hypothetical protein
MRYQRKSIAKLLPKNCFPKRIPKERFRKVKKVFKKPEKPKKY